MSPDEAYRTKTEVHVMLPQGGSDPYLLELLDGTLVDTTALVDQVCPIVSCCTPRSFGKVCLRPVVVDLPESTWPITTTLMCIFSLLRCMLANVCAMQTSDRQGLPQSEGEMVLTP